MASRAPDGRLDGTALTRQRLLASSIDIVAEGGCQGVAAEQVASGAGTTRGEFDRHFSGEEECLRAAFEEICDRFDCHLLPIYLSDKPWRERIRAATYAAVDYCLRSENEILFVLATWARYGGLDRTDRSLQLHLGQIDALRHDLGEESEIPPSAAELSLGSFLETVARLGAQERLRDLPELVPDLLYNLFRLYLGVEAAEEELALAAASSRL